MTQTIQLETSYLQAETDVEFKDCSIGDLLREAVACAPQRLALQDSMKALDDSEPGWTYQQLLDESIRVAHALLSDFEPGDHVATWCGGQTELVIFHLGAALAGVVLVTLNPACRGHEIAYLLSQSNAKGLYTDREFRGMDNEALINELRGEWPQLKTIVYSDEWQTWLDSATTHTLPNVKGNDAALILYTSGTTGKPKGVVLKHNSLVNNACLGGSRFGLNEGSSWLNVLPMFHVGGSVTVSLGCIANVGTQFFVSAFEPNHVLQALESNKVTITLMVPTMILALMQADSFDTTNLSSLEVIITGATTVPPELVRQARDKIGCELMVMFGQTEAGGCMALTHRDDNEDRICNTVGKALPLSEMKIISTTNGAVLPIGEIGEICVRSPFVMQEYFESAEKTAQTLDAEGWIHSGDLGAMRSDGYFAITGRLKEMIIRGGENIYPREVEDALVEHPSIAQAAVLGLPDEKWGEQVAAVVVPLPKHEADIEQLREYLRANIARHKVPKIWAVTADLPLTASGKIQKFVLKERLQSGALPSTSL